MADVLYSSNTNQLRFAAEYKVDQGRQNKNKTYGLHNKKMDRDRYANAFQMH